jgi:hypothetical protein
MAGRSVKTKLPRLFYCSRILRFCRNNDLYISRQVDKETGQKFDHLTNSQLNIMKRPDAKQLLEEKIRQAEIERDDAFTAMKEHLKITAEHFHPLQMLKNAFHSSENKTTVVDSALGAASGFLVKKAVVRASRNPLLKLLGSALGIGVANFVRKHPDGIKFVGGKLLRKLFNRKTDSAVE